MSPLEQQVLTASVLARIRSIESRKEDTEAARDLLAQLDASVLASAFRGELVPQNTTDEPVVLPPEAQATPSSSCPKGKRRGRKPAQLELGET